MGVKIGDMLVQAGIITGDQLGEALKCQVIYGGKIGTNLIELGFISEDTIAGFLSKKLGVPYVNQETLADIPPNIIRIIPKELVEKYHVIPVSLEKNRLTLALEDPTDLNVIDEISFITNFVVSPVVTPEVDLMLALERYYGIKRNTRYVSVRDKPAAIVKPAPPVAPIEKISDLEEELEEAEIIQEEARKSFLKEFSIDDLSRTLAESGDREVIADVISQYLGDKFSRMALFIVKGKKAVGWRAMNEGEPLEGIEDMQISLQEPSVLKTVAEGNSFYLGPIPETETNQELISSMGGNPPIAALLVPIAMMGKVVNILYVDGGEKELGDTLLDIQRLANKASMAFEILILKNKIMMT
ncbi:MAG: hypothetical protein RQ824_09040 [bacterium]|nr:hypothetical protein [bacterium]